MNAKLIIVGGKANKAEIALRLPTIIGRSREADLTMAHPMVSRQHCELYEDGGLLKIRDLGSLNGTFVGEKQIHEAELHPNTEFTVGPLTFRVEYDYVEGGSSAPAPVAAADSPPTFVEPDAPLPDSPETERQTVQDQADFVEVEQRPAGPRPPEAEPVAPADQPPGIAPADGELPDFAAWDAFEQGPGKRQAAQEVAPQADETPGKAKAGPSRPSGESARPDDPDGPA
jgi:hypothetical protein